MQETDQFHWHAIADFNMQIQYFTTFIFIFLFFFLVFFFRSLVTSLARHTCQDLGTNNGTKINLLSLTVLQSSAVNSRCRAAGHPFYCCETLLLVPMLLCQTFLFHKEQKLQQISFFNFFFFIFRSKIKPQRTCAK